MHEAFAYLAENTSIYRFFLKIEINLVMGSSFLVCEIPTASPIYAQEQSQASVDNYDFLAVRLQL